MQEDSLTIIYFYYKKKTDKSSVKHVVMFSRLISLNLWFICNLAYSVNKHFNLNAPTPQLLQIVSSINTSCSTDNLTWSLKYLLLSRYFFLASDIRTQDWIWLVEEKRNKKNTQIHNMTINLMATCMLLVNKSVTSCSLLRTSCIFSVYRAKCIVHRVATEVSCIVDRTSCVAT